MNIEQITVEDVLGQRFPLTECTLLCPKMGEMDYGDPAALILPDGETPVVLGNVTFLDEDGNEVDPYLDIDFG